MGEWEGCSFEDLAPQDEWRRFNTSREAARPPGGESMAELRTRMFRQLQELASRHPGGEIAVVSHADPLRAVLTHLLGRSLDYMLEFAIDPASVSIVQAEEQTWEVRSINQTGALSDQLTSIG
jgi:probable phosphoglycerate mutase